MKLSDLLPPPVRVGLIIGSIILIGAAAHHAYNAIYQRGFVAAEQIAEREKAALRRANELAIAAAETRLSRELVKIRNEKERLEDAIDRIEAEADADVDATRLGISAGSVRRIEAIR